MPNRQIRYIKLVHAIGIAVLMLFSAPASAENELKWEPWSDDLFQRAKAQNKLVILDLEAVWCHWCHVMEEETYGDAKVAAILRKNFITVRVDQDAAPDLSMRYGDWGWPATILFSPNGTELAKLQGYIPPLRMASLLEAFIADPTPGPSVISEPTVTPAKSIYLFCWPIRRLPRMLCNGVRGRMIYSSAPRLKTSLSFSISRLFGVIGVM